MTITVGGKKKEAADGLNITQLIEAENIESPLYVTVSVNDEFIQRETFDTTVVKDGDVVEFLHFMGGGCNGIQ